MSFDRTLTGHSSEPYQIKAVAELVPELDFVDTSNYFDEDCKKNVTELKPDVSVYFKHPGYQRSVRPVFSKMDIHVEFKAKERFDAFMDPRSNEDMSQITVELGSHNSMKTAGQITAYAVAQLETQYRSFIFSVLVCGRNARFLRWDRSGAIVTEAFDYTKSSQLLAHFFWRYSRLSPEQRGVDTSVCAATDAEKRKALPKLSFDDADRLRRLESTEFLKFGVPVGDGTARYFIGPVPRYAGRPLTRRATRGQAVYDPEADEVRYLKDTWRIDEEGFEKEGDVYRLLAKAGVENIATLECDGDIPGHETVTQQYVGSVWACRNVPLTKHVHYRLVLKEVGRPLTEFRSTKELLCVIRDAIIGTLSTFPPNLQY